MQLSQQIPSDGSRLSAPRAVGAKNTTGKEIPTKGSKRDRMMGPGKARWETRKPDAALRNPTRVLRFATANIGTMVRRSAEVADMMFRRNVSVAGLQEVRYKNQGTKMIRGGDGVYKFYWNGESSGHGGVGIMVRMDLVSYVIEVRRVTTRIIALELAIENEIVTVLSV